MSFKVHLVDGTYELFRAYFGAPSARSKTGREVGATRGLLRSLAGLLRDPEVTHVACAFDHVIESFRNDLFAGYKTGEGIEPDLYNQFHLAEDAARALGITVWPMIEFEADDAIATAAKRCAQDPQVSQVVIASPDKDFSQLVQDSRIVVWDRMRHHTLDANGVREKFGVLPESIPDWLGLVGDTADGIPGVPRWGAKSASAVLAQARHLEHIPTDVSAWPTGIRGAKALCESLNAHREEAILYRRLATLRTDVPLVESVDDMRWRGADAPALLQLCAILGIDQPALPQSP